MALQFLVVALVAACAAGQSDATFGDCTHCPDRQDEDSVLAIVSPLQVALCFDSPYWGKASRDMFVSTVFFSGTQKWQVRTITSCLEGRRRHILLPFLIATGGVTKIGASAAKKLVHSGASFDSNDRLKLCKIELPLPRGARDCVYRWDDYRKDVRDLDDGHDLRE